MSALAPLFTPRAVAVVGASASPGKLGSVMARQLAGSPRPVLLVNARNPDPERGMYPSLAAAIEARCVVPDLAILCVPAPVTATALREAAAAGVRAALLCAGGFAESGGDGAAHQAEVAKVVAETGIRVLGPNTSGFLAPPWGLAASFVRGTRDLRPGDVAVVAASGGVNHAVAFQLAEAGVGLSLGVGLGNAVDVTATDVLDHLADDPRPRAVALHVESVADGRGLVAAVARLTPMTPVVALVVGRSDVADFARSHTGALATSWRTTREALRQAGAVLVDDERELADAVTALAAARLTPNPDPGVGLVTAQAGPGLLLADSLRSRGVRLPLLADATVGELARLLPPLTYQRNPVDTGRPGPTFPDVLGSVAADPGVDLTAAYALIEPDALDIADAVASARARHRTDSPVVAILGGPMDEARDARERLAAVGVPSYTSPAAGAAAIRALAADARAAWRRATSEASERPERSPRTFHVPQLTAPLDEHRAKELLSALGISTPARRACDSHTEAHAALAELTELRAPVVVKILDPVVSHKTDIGGVRAGVRTHDDMRAALAALDAAGARRYLVEETAPDGLELIVGAHRDPVFGPVVLLGVGGVVAEALDDATVRLAPLTEGEAETMPDDLAARALLGRGHEGGRRRDGRRDGWRGAPPVDRAALARVLCALGDLLTASPAVTAVEVNPLRVTPQGLLALDAVVTFDDRLQEERRP